MLQAAGAHDAMARAHVDKLRAAMFKAHTLQRVSLAQLDIAARQRDLDALERERLAARVEALRREREPELAAMIILVCFALTALFFDANMPGQ